MLLCAYDNTHMFHGQKMVYGLWSSILEIIIIWLVVSTPLKKYEFFSWDYDIPNIWEHKSHVPNHQPVMGL